MSREELLDLQLERMKWCVQYAYDNVPFYQKSFKDAGVEPGDLKTLEDITKFPFVLKQDMRDNYPDGLFAVPRSKVVRLHASSGTTGQATVVGCTEKDVYKRQEQLMGVEVPDRAQALRVMWHELSRIHSHVLWLGLAADAFGFESLFMHCWRLRERVLDIFEKTTGGRVILSVVKVGGVVRDVDDAMFAYIKQVLEGLKDEYRQIMNTLLTDTSVKNRLVGVGYVSHDDAVAESMVGPFGRASGVNYDVRMLGNGWYGKLSEFQPILSNDGDCYARVQVRCLEVLQSIDIIEEVISRMPSGDIEVKVKGNPADGAEACNVLEQPRGECYYYARGNGTKFLERMRMRTPTSQNIAGMTIALKGCDLADVNNIILTIDPCISCTER